MVTLATTTKSPSPFSRCSRRKALARPSRNTSPTKKQCFQTPQAHGKADPQISSNLTKTETGNPPPASRQQKFTTETSNPQPKVFSHTSARSPRSQNVGCPAPDPEHRLASLVKGLEPPINEKPHLHPPTTSNEVTPVRKVSNNSAFPGKSDHRSS